MRKGQIIERKNKYHLIFGVKSPPHLHKFKLFDKVGAKFVEPLSHLNLEMKFSSLFLYFNPE